jgi:hypothetical protein
MSELPDLPIWITGIALAKNLDGRLEMATLASSNGWRQVWRRWESLEGGWTRWQPLGGESGTGLHQSAPALALNHDGRLEAALVAEDRTLWHAWQRYPGRAWTEWYRLETPPGRIELQNTPVLARNQDGRLEAFVRGSSRDDRFVSVWHSWQVEAGLTLGRSGPILDTLRSSESPTSRSRKTRTAAWSCSRRPTTVGFAGRGSSGSAPKASTSWSSWAELKVPPELSGEVGEGLYRPAVARNQDGRLELFMQGTDKNVWHCWQSAAGAGPWSRWSSLGRPPGGDAELAAGAQADGGLVVFAANTGSPGLSVLAQTDPNDGWSSWKPLEQPVQLLDLAMALDADRRLELWARFPGSVDPYFLKQVSPYSNEWDGGAWAAAPQPASTGPEPPAYIPTPAGSQEVPPG